MIILSYSLSSASSPCVDIGLLVEIYGSACWYWCQKKISEISGTRIASLTSYSKKKKKLKEEEDDSKTKIYLKVSIAPATVRAEQ